MPGNKPERKRTRRLKGTGSVFWSKSLGRYVGRVQVGRRADGSPKYAQRSSATAEGLQKALALVGPPGDATTVAAWLARWLAEMRCKPATRRNRTAAVKYHLEPTLGHLRVAALTPYEIETASHKWRQTVRGAPVPLHGNSVRVVLGILGTALRAAVRAGLRTDDPTASAIKPRAIRKKIDPFTVEEIGNIAVEAARRPNTRILATLAATGLRAGEALALDAGDFDAATSTLAITKTLDNRDGTPGTPKSANSARTIRVPGEPAAALAALRAAAGNRTHGPLFRTASGRRPSYPVVYQSWLRLLKRLKIRYRSLHNLRHTWASLSLAAGVPVAEVARYLGDSPATVIAVYMHATGGVDPAAVFAGLFATAAPSGPATPPAPRTPRSRRRGGARSTAART